MRIFIAVLLTFAFLAFVGTRLVQEIHYDQSVGGYLKRAADANTVGLAKDNLATALKNIEANGWTSGYTSIFWRTPDEDVGFWYANLKSALQELGEVLPGASQLEKSNVLIKLRETLLDEGKEISVTAPNGISVYPHNTAFLLWGFASFVFAGLARLFAIEDF